MNSSEKPSRTYPQAPLLGASTCIWEGDKVLLVLGAKAPKLDLWSLPGGLVEVGETLQQAAERELLEETGMEAEILGLADWVEVIRPDGPRVKYHFVIAMFVGHASSGTLKAGDDAKDARWFGLDELSQLEMTTGTPELIRKAYANWFT